MATCCAQSGSGLWVGEQGLSGRTGNLCEGEWTPRTRPSYSGHTMLQSATRTATTAMAASLRRRHSPSALPVCTAQVVNPSRRLPSLGVRPQCALVPSGAFAAYSPSSRAAASTKVHAHANASLRPNCAATAGHRRSTSSATTRTRPWSGTDTPASLAWRRSIPFGPSQHRTRTSDIRQNLLRLLRGLASGVGRTTEPLDAVLLSRQSSRPD